MRARRGAALAALLLLSLSACVHPRGGKPAPAPVPSPSGPAQPNPALPPPPPEPTPNPVGQIALSALPGWAQEDHAAALAALQAGCGVARAEAGLCVRLRALGALPAPAAKAALETLLRARQIGGTGVLTGYFAPVYEARRRSDAEFSAPVRPRPSDLSDRPYADRAAIEARDAAEALAWMRPEDLFFLQIQGSGVLVFEDGTRRKALFAGTNNQPFVAIARPMREQGLLAADNTSGDAIRGWLAAHRGAEAQRVMRLNGRYVFFNLAEDDGREPAGAAGVALTAGRAIAVDPAFHAYGTGFWISADAPILAGAFPSYRRVVSALDTGGAIRGEVRADLYIGSGDAAGTEAGRIRHDLRMYRLEAAP